VLSLLTAVWFHVPHSTKMLNANKTETAKHDKEEEEEKDKD
jgi:hypothetical protein